MSATVYRAGIGSRIAIVLLAGFLLVPFLGAGATAIALAADGSSVLALILLLTAVATGFLAELVVREAGCRLRWRVELRDDQLLLNLPRSRSYLAKPAAFTGNFSRNDVHSVDWREERYDTMGMSVVVRAWALVLKDKRIILLGEDRPIANTPSYTHLVGDAAEAIAGWLGKSPKKRAPVVGDPGILGTWLARAPDW